MGSYCTILRFLLTDTMVKDTFRTKETKKYKSQTEQSQLVQYISIHKSKSVVKKCWGRDILMLIKEYRYKWHQGKLKSPHKLVPWLMLYTINKKTMTYWKCSSKSNLIFEKGINKYCGRRPILFHVCQH